MNNRFLFCTICAIILLMGNVCSAQVTGTIVNREKQPVGGASVTLTCKGSPAKNISISNMKGEFRVETKTLEGQDCILEIRHAAYAPYLLSLQKIPKAIELDTIRLEDNVLEEVTVMADRIIHKVDRKLLFPSQDDIRLSSSGFDLIDKVNLPGVYVDTANKKVERRGSGSVPVFINEKRASQADVVALRPDEVVRIEYIDNPGVEFGLETPTAIINFVVKPRVKGMSIGFNLNDAVTTLNGQNYIYAQYNHRLSKWGIYYQNDFSKLSRRHIDQTDSYILSDGNLHGIRREGMNTKLAYANHDFGITYDWTKKGQYTFMAQASCHFYNSPDRGHRQRIYETGKPTYYALTEPTEHYFSPTIDLFFRRYFKKNRTLTFNLVGTMYDTKYGYSFKTFDNEDFGLPTSQYGYDTDGKRYSLIGDVKFSQPLGKSSWTSGVSHLQGYTKNKYTGTSDIINDMHNSSTYLYSQISGRFSNLRYMLGLGGSYQYYSQGTESYHYFLLRPSLSLSHPFLDKGNIRYVFNISPNAPSLANLSNNRQQSNEYEYHVGNPNLKPYSRYTQTLTLSYEHKYFYTENTTGYTYSRNPILEEITRHSDANGRTWFDLGYEQQKSAADFWNYTTVQLYIIPNVLTLDGGFSYLLSRYVGNNYTHDFHRLWGYVGSKLFFGKWSFRASWSAKERNFRGESENTTGQNIEAQVNYKLSQNLSIGLYGSHLFLKNGSTFGEATHSQFIKKDLTVYIPEWGNMISLNLTWNLSRGRKYQSDQKGVWNRDSETGIFKGK